VTEEQRTTRYEASKLDIERGGIVLIHGVAYILGKLTYGWHTPGGGFIPAREWVKADELARRMADLYAQGMAKRGIIY
jgi:hypothetical protein